MIPKAKRSKRVRKQSAREPELPQVGSFITVEYPEIDADVWYEFGEYCGRVLRREHDRIQVFFPFDDAPENTIWLQLLGDDEIGTYKWKDCSTPALVKVRAASQKQEQYVLTRISEERWAKLLSGSRIGRRT